jgi:transcriptional regulator with XRE-family HTH domain
MRESLGQRLKRLREAADLSMAQLSARTGGEVSKATICHIETGHVKNPSFLAIQLIAVALPCDLDVLAGHESLVR